MASFMKKRLKNNNNNKQQTKKQKNKGPDHVVLPLEELRRVVTAQLRRPSVSFYYTPS